MCRALLHYKMKVSNIYSFRNVIFIKKNNIYKRQWMNVKNTVWNNKNLQIFLNKLSFNILKKIIFFM